MNYEPICKCAHCGGSIKIASLYDDIFYRYIDVYQCASCGRFKKNEKQLKELGLDDK